MVTKILLTLLVISGISWLPWYIGRKVFGIDDDHVEAYLVGFLGEGCILLFLGFAAGIVDLIWY